MKLVVAEKPSVGVSIAKVVGADERNDGYMEGNGYVVSWCVGHLVTLAEPEEYGEEYKKWNIKTLPIIPDNWKTKNITSTYKQFKVLKELISRKDIEYIVCATDAGREGELIFRLVYNRVGLKRKVKRLWISSMEESAIEKGMNNLKDDSEYDGLYKSALCRGRADWLIGMNMTRLFTLVNGTTTHVGRVQTPTIKMIVDRDIEIRNFVPKDYYVLNALLDGFSASKRIDEKVEAINVLNKCKGKDGIIIKLEEKTKSQSAPKLFDLTSLQQEANSLFKMTAVQTLDTVQSLYEKKLCTYPRTDSSFLTEDMKESTLMLINALSGKLNITSFEMEKVNVDKVINNKKVSDHHAIIPTKTSLSADIYSLEHNEHNILNLLMYRLLSSVYLPYKYKSTKVIVSIEGEDFEANGKQTIDLGFKNIENLFLKFINRKEQNSDVILPTLTKGQTFKNVEITSTTKKTTPPAAYTEKSLLGSMETAGKFVDDEELKEVLKEGGIGTPATRAEIIEKIINNGYIERKNNKLIPTGLGYNLIKTVPEVLSSPAITAEWEKRLNLIAKGEESDTSFMNDIENQIKKIVDSNRGKVKEQRGGSAISKCPICSKAVIENSKAYTCVDKKCKFVIWKNIASKKISREQAKQLIEKQKTNLITGFKSKEGKSFSAYLVLKDDFTVAFEFPKTKKKKNSFKSKFK